MYFAQFDIFVGDFESKESDKVFVVGIPYPSQGCGRISNHISFADNINKNAVGAVKEYGIRAVQTIDGNSSSTSMSLFVYRIPYYVQVGITVRNTAGKGIANVNVSFCHIDPDTARNDQDPSFCPLVSFITDKRGLAVGSIRVSSPLWVNQLEQFNVTASLIETIITGQKVTHVFSPPSQILTFSHIVGSGSVTITDVTKVKIWGQVVFDPRNVGGFFCPFANVPVTYVDFSGTETNTTTATDGTFNFTTGFGETADLFIPDYLGNTWTAKMITWKNYYYTKTPSPTTAPIAGFPTGSALMSIKSEHKIITAKTYLSTSQVAKHAHKFLTDPLLPGVLPTSSPSMEAIPQVAGLYFQVYEGYFNDDINFFAKSSPYASGFSDNFDSIASASNDYLVDTDFQTLVSVEWFGYLFTPSGSTGNWSISINSDDASFVWIGNSALNGYDANNALISNSGVHSARELTTVIYLLENATYAFRVQYGQFIGDCQLVITLHAPSHVKTHGVGYFFSEPTPSAAPTASPTNEPSKVVIEGAGLYFRVFKGYFFDDVNFFVTKQFYAGGKSDVLSSLSSATNGYLIETNSQQLVSAEWFGYLLIPVESGGLWTISLTSDDSSILWLGDVALDQYNMSNCFINNTGIHPLRTKSNTTQLRENQYYAIRIQYGQYLGEYNMIVKFLSPDGVVSDGKGILFHSASPSSVPTTSPSTQTMTPSVIPSFGPTFSPSIEPSTKLSTPPSCNPSGVPSRHPTVLPTKMPTSIPSSLTTIRPSNTPSSLPTIARTNIPSLLPTFIPTLTTTSPPMNTPSVNPTAIRTVVPSNSITFGPVCNPTLSTSKSPSFSPSLLPSVTKSPTMIPTYASTQNPTIKPTASSNPSIAQSASPSSKSTALPSCIPSASGSPTNVPSTAPKKSSRSLLSIKSNSVAPTSGPQSVGPTRAPITSRPSAKLTNAPSGIPSGSPTACPSSKPTSSPSANPSAFPSFEPSEVPTTSPTATVGLLFNIFNGLKYQPPSLFTGFSDNFESLSTATDGLITNISVSNISIQWFGYLLTPKSAANTEFWTFWAISDDSCSVSLEGNLIISGCAENGNLLTGSTTLNANTYYSIAFSYSSSNLQRKFQLFFKAPNTRLSSDFSNYLFYSTSRLMVLTPNPTLSPSAYPVLRPSIEPITIDPTEFPTNQPTISSALLYGLLFNAYSLNFNLNTNFFTENVPFLAGYSFDLSSLQSATNEQDLLGGALSIEWFGYFYTATADDGEWTFQIKSDSKSVFYVWLGDHALTDYTKSYAMINPTKSQSDPQALYASRYYPIRIQFGTNSLTLATSFSFSFEPPSGPLIPSFNYFQSLKPPEISFPDISENQLLHEFTFSTKDVRGSIVTDSVGSMTAQLVGVVTQGGNAVFTGESTEYILLQPFILSFSNSITIEVWATFDASNNQQATLFSFGSINHNINLLAAFADERVYVAFVFDGSSNTSSVYLNGQLSYNTSDVSYTELSAIATTGYNYIGRNALGTGPGMTASVEAVRVWYGALHSTEIYTNYLSGYQASSLYISDDLTITDINVTYFATTLQQIQVGVFGGYDLMSPMFGSETAFSIKALDKQCGYSRTIYLEPSTSGTSICIAAMNYTITMISAPQVMPQFAPDVCDSQNPQTPCACANSKDPLAYFSDSNQLSQNITIIQANNTIYTVNYIYVSGVCLQAVGTESFSLSDGIISMQNGIKYSCFGSSTSFLSSKTSRYIHFVLFERYPATFEWYNPATQQALLLTRYSNVKFDRNISSATLFVHDQVSGGTSSELSYDTTLVGGYPVGVYYTINASLPNPSPPYDWLFQVSVQRIGLDGKNEIDTISWYIAVLGVIPNEIPNYYPIASDPTMIFLVLRDPPGGASSTSITAGSSIDFSLSIEGGHTHDYSSSSSSDSSGSFQFKLEDVVAAFGFGVDTTATAVNHGTDQSSSHSFQVSSARSSSSSYEYSFYFEYDFSTSTNPHLAGHPSDVIVGGGVDLIVNQAIRGKFLPANLLLHHSIHNLLFTLYLLLFS